MRTQTIQRAAEDLLKADRVIALTGAGISVQSGIPDFRSSTGLWAKYDPEEYATIEAFQANPQKVWKMLEEMIGLIMDAKPNPAHFGLAELERLGKLQAVITQNVDGLHQAAGSQKVIEFHGSNATLSCNFCKCQVKTASLCLKNLPPRCPDCHAILKPDVVFFGEEIPWQALVDAMEAARNCDLILVIGTSAMVYPAADIPRTAKENDARIIEINQEMTPLTSSVSDYIVQGSCAEIVPRMVERVKTLMGHQVIPFPQ